MNFTANNTAYSEPNAIGNAAEWLSAVVTGSSATIAATLAIAGLGLAMMHGRINVRDGVRVVAGCFILFGAPVIARDLLSLAGWNAGPAVIEVRASPAPIVMPSAPSPNRDPYAGASVPM